MATGSLCRYREAGKKAWNQSLRTHDGKSINDRCNIEEQRQRLTEFELLLIILLFLVFLLLQPLKEGPRVILLLWGLWGVQKQTCERKHSCMYSRGLVHFRSVCKRLCSYLLGLQVSWLSPIPPVSSSSSRQAQIPTQTSCWGRRQLPRPLPSQLTYTQTKHTSRYYSKLSFYWFYSSALVQALKNPYWSTPSQNTYM